MVNINRQIMLEGMRADFIAVDALSQRLIERARMSERISLPHAARDGIRSGAFAKIKMA